MRFLACVLLLIAAVVPPGLAQVQHQVVAYHCPIHGYSSGNYSYCPVAGCPYGRSPAPSASSTPSSGLSPAQQAVGQAAYQGGYAIGQALGRALFGDPQESARQAELKRQQEAAAAEEERRLAAKRAAERAAKAEADRKAAILRAALLDKQLGLAAFKAKNWEQAVARLTAALGGLPNDPEVLTKLTAARKKLAQEQERHRRNQEAFNPFSTVTPNSRFSIPVQQAAPISKVNAESPYGPSSLPLPNRVQQSESDSLSPTGLWQQDVAAAERESRTIILEAKEIGNRNVANSALDTSGTGIAGLSGVDTGGAGPGSGLGAPNESKSKTEIGDVVGAQPVGTQNQPAAAGNEGGKGYGIPGLPGVYVGGPGPGSGLTAPNGSMLKTQIGDSVGAQPAGTQNQPAAAGNEGGKGYGIPGLPGVYVGGPGPGSGLTAPNGSMLKTQIGDSVGANNIGTAAASAGQAGTTPVAIQAAPVSFASGSPRMATQVSAGAAAPSVQPVPQPIAMSQPQTELPPSSGLRQTQASTTSIFGRTGSSGATSAGDQLMSMAANGENPGKNFDSGGKYDGSLNYGGGGTAFSDSSAVDLRGKQGIVDPSVLKGNRRDSIVSSPRQPHEVPTPYIPESEKRLPQTASKYIPPTRPTFIEPTSHAQGELTKKLADHQGTLDAMYAAGSSYGPEKHPPGYSILQRFHLATDGTEATLYGKVGTDLKPTAIILAFRGTADANDWTYGNVANGAAKWLPSSTGSQAYVSAVLIAKRVKQELGSSVTLTGHSFGGGEAALASVATGLPAITFNAAGVNPADYGYSANADTSKITNYHLTGEPLTTAQNKVTVGNLPANHYTRLLPTALGRQVEVAPVVSTASGNTVWESVKGTIAENGSEYYQSVGFHGMAAVEPAMIKYLSEQ